MEQVMDYLSLSCNCIRILGARSVVSEGGGLRSRFFSCQNKVVCYVR